MNLIYDFKSDYSEIVRHHLNNFGYTGLPDDLRSLLKIYYNYQRRIVEPVSRKIMIPDGFSCPPEVNQGFNALLEKIREGSDLSPHLSTKLKRADYNDMLLNDWDIHHLHLGEIIESDGFVNRTGLVLFIRFTAICAYLIVIARHGTWSNRDMIQILHDNWPDSLEDHTIKGIVGIEKNPTSEEIDALRKANINSVVEIDGKFYFSIGGGYMSSGDSMIVVHQVDRIMIRIHDFEEHVSHNSQFYKKQVRKIYSGKLDFLKLNFTVDTAGMAYVIIQPFNMPFELGNL